MKQDDFVWRFARHVLLRSSLYIAAVIIGASPFFSQTIADATITSSTMPSTVSADALPTVQVDGVVWATATYGNTVYATGRFSYARPSGVKLGGAGSVVRSNLLAFNAATGILDTTFVHSLEGSTNSPCWGSTATGAQGCSIAVSPDGTRLYVGGSFTSADGQAHSNFAAFDLTTNKVLPGFAGTNSRVNSVSATNTGVYIGGGFTTAGGTSHSKVAAYTLDGSINSNWHADVTGNVRAVVAVGDRLVIGGNFTKINGATYYSLGAVSLATGNNITPWKSQSSTFPIRMQDPTGNGGTGVTSLSTDGTQVYLTAFTYITGVSHPGTFEGRAAINATDGSLVWMNDCGGDSYGAFPIGQVLYSASHAHRCQSIGGFPETTPRTHHHALAETTFATGKNNIANGGSFPNYVGQPAGSLLNWFPDFTTGTFTGLSQGPWSVSGNSNYVIYGGEFTAVNGKSQQGLVRFATRSLAPNKIGPTSYGTTRATAATPADSNGESIVTIQTTSDKDDTSLTYTVYRSDSSTPIAAQTVESTFWNEPVWTFVDTGRAPGQVASYRVVVTDPHSNQTSTDFTNYAASPIDMRYATDADFAKALGTATASEKVSGIYRYRDFKNGRAYWTQRSGVHYITGSIKTKFISGGAHGTYGEPTTDMTKDYVNYKGTYVDFYNNRTFYYTSANGTHEIKGKIRERWISLGRSSYICGYPISNETTASDGKGKYNKMSGSGCYIYYSAASGAWSVRGKIAEKWLSLGGVKSKLKYPISDEYKTSYGARSDFQGGYIKWNSAKKTATVVYN